MLRLESVLQETHRSVEYSKGFLRLALRGYEGGGLGGWDTVLWDSGAFVGTCGVDVGHAPRPARAELGHVLSREHWEKGLVLEAARAVIRFGLGRMNLNRVEARCIAESVASARVMEKAGMSYEGTLSEREFIKGATGT